MLRIYDHLCTDEEEKRANSDPKFKQELMDKYKPEYFHKKLESVIKVKPFTEVEKIPVNWLWEPFIPYGDVTLVEGNGMAGKTTALIRMACLCSKGIQPPAVKNGQMVTEEKHMDPITTLYIGVEANNETEIRPAIDYGKGDISRFCFLDQTHTPFVIKPEYLEEAIRQSGAKLVIIDPYTSFLPDDVSLNVSTDMRGLMTKLMNLARKTGVAVVLIGHLRKSFGKAIYSGYGSGDIVNTMRSVLLVERDEYGINSLKVLKTNYFGVNPYYKVALMMDEDYCVHFEDYELIKQQAIAEQQLLNGSTDLGALSESRRSSMSKKTQCALRIKELLADGPVKSDDIVSALMDEGFSKRTVYRGFKELDGISYYDDNRTVYWKLAEKKEDSQ